jgi:hypothetical protein
MSCKGGPPTPHMRGCSCCLPGAGCQERAARSGLPALFALRVAAWDSLRRLQVGVSLLLERVAQPGWQGALADPARVLAGPRLRLLLLRCARPAQMPLFPFCARAMQWLPPWASMQHLELPQPAVVGPTLYRPCRSPQCRHAGTRLLGPLVGGAALPMPPAVTLASQAVLLLLVNINEAYCETPVSIGT